MLIDIDSYYLPLDGMAPAERDRVNFDHPDTIDFPLLVAQLRQLQAGHSIEKPVYDFTRHTRATRTEHVEPREVIVVEGILALASPQLRELLDLRVFVDVPDEVRYARRLTRDLHGTRSHRRERAVAVREHGAADAQRVRGTVQGAGRRRAARGAERRCEAPGAAGACSSGGATFVAQEGE